jgi:hypothetical protein
MPDVGSFGIDVYGRIMRAVANEWVNRWLCTTIDADKLTTTDSQTEANADVLGKNYICGDFFINITFLILATGKAEAGIAYS